MRLLAAKAREEAEVLDACARAEDALTAARAAWEADPTPETLAAYEQAQAEMYRLRSFLRAAAQERKVAAVPARPAGRVRRDRAYGQPPQGRRRGGDA